MRRDLFGDGVTVRFNKNGIVNRRTDFDASLHAQDAGEPQHLSAIGLHGEIAQRARIGVHAHPHGPAKHSLQFAGEHGLVERRIRPAPEAGIGLPVEPEQLASMGWRLPNSLGKRLGAHAVLDGEHAGLEALAHRPVAFLGRTGWRSAGLLGEFEIRVAGRIGLLHQSIARQRRRNAEFLLAPIDIGKRLAGLRLNQRPQPNRGAKDELCIGRLIAPCR